MLWINLYEDIFGNDYAIGVCVDKILKLRPVLFKNISGDWLALSLILVTLDNKSSKVTKSVIIFKL